jgi:hypothetical protein
LEHYLYYGDTQYIGISKPTERFGLTRVYVQNEPTDVVNIPNVRKLLHYSLYGVDWGVDIITVSCIFWNEKYSMMDAFVPSIHDADTTQQAAMKIYRHFPRKEESGRTGNFIGLFFHTRRN